MLNVNNIVIQHQEGRTICFIHYLRKRIDLIFARSLKFENLDFWYVII